MATSNLPPSNLAVCWLLGAMSILGLSPTRAHIAAVAWQMPDRPVVQNADAAPAESVVGIADALVRQLYLPVRWTDCVQALAARGATHVAECGPGKVLSGLVKRIDKSLDARALGAPADFEATLAEWKN